MAKRMEFKGSATRVDMTASERLSRIIDSLYDGQSTTSLKVNTRIIGLRGDSTAAFIKSILDNALSGMSGSFSFKFRTATGVQRERDLVTVTDALHKESDYALSAAYELLSEEDKRMGEVIARQNVIRKVLLDLCSTMEDAAAFVDNWLSTNNKLFIPDGAQLESTIVGGHRSYLPPKNMVGYKKKIDETLPGQPEVWTKTSEIYGRKRVPLKGEASITVAFEAVAELAKSWEDFWAKADDPKDDNELIDKVMEWVETLPHQDHEIEINKLSDAEIIKCKKEAESLYREMLNRRA